VLSAQAWQSTLIGSPEENEFSGCLDAAPAWSAKGIHLFHFNALIS
jgi:hypothetical protein